VRFGRVSRLCQALAIVNNLLTKTAARWKIPPALASVVIARDRYCVYCGRIFETAPSPRATWASWEHIVNDMSLIGEANIALCCIGCNSSKGTKSLRNWLDSKCCAERGVTMQTLAPIAISRLSLTVALLGASAEWRLTRRSTPLPSVAGRYAINPRSAG
jgi:hypothetical protein